MTRLTSGLVGTGGMIRLILRRDRVILPVWMLTTIGVVLQWAGTAGTVYPTAAARQARFDEVAGTPMYLLFQGQMFDTSLGAVVAQRGVPQGAMAAALGAALLLARHTRAEEQTGRRELLGSTVIGRHAPLTTALAVLFGCGLLIGAVSAAGLAVSGLPFAGSVCAGLVIGCGAWVTATTTAVLAQLSQSARAVAVGGFAVYFALHLFRGIGAIGGDSTAWLGWLTPNGWLEYTRPYAGERWWVFALVALWVALLGGMAYVLSARRDLGAGVLPARLGPALAAPSLRGPVGLAWRMHRPMLTVWVTVAAGLGLVLGSIGGEAMQEYARSRWVLEFARAVGSDRPADALFIYVISLMAIATMMYTVMTVLRLRSEETGGGAETVLAEPVTRRRWMAAHLGFAVAVPVLVLAVLGLGVGITSGIRNGDLGGELTYMLGLTIPMSPAVWVITGITAAAFGLLPRAATVVGWTAVATGIAAEIAVKASILPEWVFRAVSPYAHVSLANDPNVLDYLVLTLIATGLIAVGTAAFNRRDLVA